MQTRRSSLLSVHLSAGLCLALCASTLSQVVPEFEGFIRVQNQRFVDSNCRDFPLTGMNT